MKIALVSDEWHPIDSYIQNWLKRQGMELLLFGSFLSHQDESWVEMTLQAAQAVANGEAEEGIFLCWSGTGACIAANKVKGIRAALCNDPETAKLARIWNHANVLALSNRTLTETLVDTLLPAWFEPYDVAIGEAGVKQLNAFEAK